MTGLMHSVGIRIKIFTEPRQFPIVGMQEIVVDYIERPLTKALLLVLNTLFCVALAAGAIYAVLNISFGKG